MTYQTGSVDKNGIARTADGRMYVTLTGATSAIGYTTGGGGTVTQLTDKSTGVTLNKPSGQITMNGALLGNVTPVTFTLTNSQISATDVLVLIHSSVGTNGAYTLNAFPSNGSAVISVRNISSAALSEAIVISFAVIKGSAT